MSLENLNHLLSVGELKKLGILLDIGNIKADGFSIENYINRFSKRIYGIHVKKRGIFFKKSEKINKPYHELKYVIGKISKLTNLNDITLQSFRSNSFYIDELRLVNKIVKKEIKKIKFKNMNIIKNRTALITGGGGLLGPQHAIALALEKIKIVLVDKKEIKLKKSQKKNFV